MIKHKAPPITTEAPALTLTESDIATLAERYSLFGDEIRTDKQRRIDYAENNIRDVEDGIARRERDIAEYRQNIENYREAIEQYRAELDALPIPEPTKPEEVQADLDRLARLSYVKSVAIEYESDAPYLIITTRENALFTTLNKKYSRAERWYRTRAPYRIALPAYKIRVGFQPSSTRANNTQNLAIAFANPEQDTAHFLPWITHYNFEPHPHWGTTSVSRPEQRGDYRGICLGEYESEITRAFAKSVAEGVIQLAVYLQNAGTPHAYVHHREHWALWMGKQEYNLAIVPSEKETETLEETNIDDSDDRWCDCRPSEDDECEDDDCLCDCHS